MKKVLSVLVAAIMLAALCVPAFAAGEAVNMTADKKTVAVGETVTIKVEVTNLSSIHAAVNFDEDAFEYVSSKAGNVMKDLATIDDKEAGKVEIATMANDPATGVVLEVSLKYKGGDGKITLDVNEAIGEGVEVIDALAGTAVKTLTITEKAAPTTQKPADKPAEQPTKKPAASTTKAPSKGNVSKVTNPKSGGTVSVAASAAAVVVMAAAVAYTMKKKNED